MCPYMDIENNMCKKFGGKCSFINEYAGPRVFTGSEHCGLINIGIDKPIPEFKTVEPKHHRIVYEYKNYYS